MIRSNNKKYNANEISEIVVKKINNRIKVYNQETIPVLNHYKNQNKHIPIDGIGSIDEIFELIISKIEEK